MSGGSYEYMSSRMEDGELEPFVRYAGYLEEDLQTIALRLRGVFLALEEGRRPPLLENYQRKHEAAMALGFVIQRVQAARAKMHELAEEAKALARVARAVEWWASGDWGEEEVLDAALALESPSSSVSNSTRLPPGAG